LLILREAVMGTTRFSDFRKALGVAADVLTERLNALVEHGVLEKVPYQQPGERPRASYVLTPAGHELILVLAALPWGDKYLPWPDGPGVVRRVEGTDQPVHVGFIDDRGHEVDHTRAAMVPTAIYPAPTGS
jgi:DNA-binding HxlR family transcriptional regulator